MHVSLLACGKICGIVGTPARYKYIDPLRHSESSFLRNGYGGGTAGAGSM